MDDTVDVAVVGIVVDVEVGIVVDEENVKSYIVAGVERMMLRHL